MPVAQELRDRFNRRFAATAPDWVKRRLGHPLAAPMDLDAMAPLREAGTDVLGDPALLEALLPALGLNDEAPQLFPDDLRPRLGRGLRFWQYPCQLAPYLVHLSTLGVRRYMEVGVQHGGTFVVTVEYLSRFAPVERAVAVDLLNVPALRRYEGLRPGARFLRQDSSSRAFAEFVRREGPFDLVLIDGDHSREAVRRDWETVRPHARAVAFHDIVDAYCPGVRETWQELRGEEAGRYEFHEFTAQYPEVTEREGDTFLGLGLAVRRAG